MELRLPGGKQVDPKLKSETIILTFMGEIKDVNIY